MSSLNKVQIIGNVSQEPEIRQTASGQHVASFNVATNRSWKDASWVKQENVEFHSIVVWGKLAELVQQYVQKGKKIYLEWRLQTRHWDDANGQKKHKTEIVADEIIFLWDPAKKDIDANDSIKSEKEVDEINTEEIPF